MNIADRTRIVVLVLGALVMADPAVGDDGANDGHAGVRPVQGGPLDSVQPEPPAGSIFKSDAEIKQDIRNALTWSATVGSTRIEVDVRLGVATLTGVVDTPTEAREAARLAAEAGARRVVNRLEVAP